MIYFIRHGQTELNKLEILQSTSDYPLNEQGKAEAREAAEKLINRGIVFSHVYSSPYIRAVQTAQIVTGIDPITDDRLKEMNYGPYEGIPVKDMPGELWQFFTNITVQRAPEGMEQLDHLIARGASFVNDIREQAVNENVLVATHAVILKGILEYLSPESKGSYWMKPMHNCEVYACEVTADGFSIPVKLDL